MKLLNKIKINCVIKNPYSSLKNIYNFELFFIFSRVYNNKLQYFHVLLYLTIKLKANFRRITHILKNL